MAYVIVDLETGGLDPKLPILEISYQIVEDLHQASSRVINTSLITTPNLAQLIEHVDPIVQKMHTDNGLWAALANPDLPKDDLASIDDDLAFLLQTYAGPHYLVGNSIRLDRAFIEAQMPLFAAMLHYRQIDLTSSDLLIQAVGMPSTKHMKEVGGHRTASDVEDTIIQLKSQLGILRTARIAGEQRLLEAL